MGMSELKMQADPTGIHVAQGLLTYIESCCKCASCADTAKQVNHILADLQTKHEAEVREIVAKAYERCAGSLVSMRNCDDIIQMEDWARDILSGKENLE